LFLDNGVRSLPNLIRHNLRELSLVNASLDDAGAATFADTLQHNHTLTYLHVSDESIGAQGAVALADSLKSNTTLETVDLCLSQSSLEEVTVLPICPEIQHKTSKSRFCGGGYDSTNCFSAFEGALFSNTTLIRLEIGKLTLSTAIEDALLRNWELLDLRDWFPDYASETLAVKSRILPHLLCHQSKGTIDTLFEFLHSQGVSFCALNGIARRAH